MTVPKPRNFQAMADAWDNPTAYAAELHRYYEQLERDGHRMPTPELVKEN